MAKTKKDKQPKEDGKQLARWAFTWWVEGEDNRLKLVKWLTANSKKWVFQQERGEEDGRIHFQGRMSMKKRKRISELSQLADELNKIKHVHFSVEADEKGSEFYAMKDDTKVEGPWSDKDKPAYVPKEWLDIPDQPWWAEAESHLASQGRRKVLIVVNQSGDIGKSAFVKKILMDGGISVPSTMDTSDKMMQWVHGRMEGRDRDKCVTITIDIPRATAKKAFFWTKVCETLECLKDGRAYDWRYKAQEVFFASPRIIVFTNDEPPSHLLSADRWVLMPVEPAPPPSPPAGVGEGDLALAL